MKLSMKAARAALSPISAALERDEAATVDAIIQVAVSSIYAELSNLAAKQGVSLRDYALLPFGGAGPLLATRVAEELGMDRILVPEAPGTLCSLGALFADVSKPFVRSIALPADRAADVLKAAFATLSAEADAWLRNEASHLSAQRFEVAADMRYLGQSYEIDVELKAQWVKEGALEPIVAAFHRRHQAMFAHADASAPVEIMDLRLMVVGTTSKPFSATQAKRPTKRPVKREQRPVAIDGTFRSVPVMRRTDFVQRTSLRGPAIIEQDDTTTYVALNWAAAAHASGALIIERCR